MNIKFYIKEYRLKKGYSQVKLAKLSGVCKSNISAYELGKIKNPGFKEIVSIAKALEVTLEMIYEEI